MFRILFHFVWFFEEKFVKNGRIKSGGKTFSEKTDQQDALFFLPNGWRSRVWYKHPRYLNPFWFFILLSFHMIWKIMQKFFEYNLLSFWNFLNLDVYWVLQILILSNCIHYAKQRQKYFKIIWEEKKLNT